MDAEEEVCGVWCVDNPIGTSRSYSFRIISVEYSISSSTEDGDPNTLDDDPEVGGPSVRLVCSHTSKTVSCSLGNKTALRSF